jgi:hypothetical protein
MLDLPSRTVIDSLRQRRLSFFSWWLEAMEKIW